MCEGLSDWISEEDDERSGSSIDPVVPGEETGFAAEVKDGALAANESLREIVDTKGRVLDFGSRRDAEDFASRLSNTGGSLRIQAVPDNEPKDIEGYVLKGHNPSIKEPAAVDGDTMTFDVGANLYGSLGETIVFGSPKPYPLIHFVRQDLGIDDSEASLHVKVHRGERITFENRTGRDSWIPDCVVDATNGWHGERLERYYCEIKTGDASFERSQIDAMRTLADDKRVLKIRVRIDDLPDQYSMRITEVEST